MYAVFLVCAYFYTLLCRVVYLSFDYSCVYTTILSCIWTNIFTNLYSFTTWYPNFGKIVFGTKNNSWPDHQISQQHFFIIWRSVGETPDQLFFMNVYQNGPTGNQLILGSTIKKNIHFLYRAKLAILVLITVFKSPANKVNWLFAFLLLLLQKKKKTAPNPNLGKLFLPTFFFWLRTSNLSTSFLHNWQAGLHRCSRGCSTNTFITD